MLVITLCIQEVLSISEINKRMNLATKTVKTNKFSVKGGVRLGYQLEKGFLDELAFMQDNEEGV